MTEWNLRPLRIASVIVALLLVAAMNFPPTKYARTTWCGFPARVDRWTRLTHQEQVLVRWRLASGSDEADARHFCATCHGNRDVGPRTKHLHEAWVQPGLEAPGMAADALRAGLARRMPQFDEWSVYSLQRAPDGGPILVLYPMSATPLRGAH